MKRIITMALLVAGVTTMVAENGMIEKNTIQTDKKNYCCPIKLPNSRDRLLDC